MDTHALINLIETVSKTLNEQGFEHISLSHEGSSLTLNKKSIGGHGIQGSVPMEAAPYGGPVAPVATPSISREIKESSKEEKTQGSLSEEAFKTIDSPIVGTFYDSPSPEAAPFVKVGDKVKQGDVVCIIEAMKLMNEIEAECDGEIVEVLISNEGPVEYGQALFRIK